MRELLEARSLSGTRDHLSRHPLAGGSKLSELPALVDAAGT